ncbi:MAG TPA: tetratricopeptide repeat protein, partial [Candidatus Obscuribacterales bacterium]
PARPPVDNRAASGSIEVKEDFGRLIRRIMYSNSGNFQAIVLPDSSSPKVIAVNNRDWNQYKELAEKAQQQGNFAQAEFMWLAALDEAKNFHASDPRLLISLDNLASLYCSIGRYDQAESFCKRAIDVATRFFGESHTYLAHCLNNLAGIYYHQRRYSEAEPLCRRVLEIYEKAHGEEHPDVGMAVNNLAMLYHVQGKYKLAERLYLRAIDIRTASLEMGHPLIVTLLENYANLLDSTGRHEQAEEVRSEARCSSTRHTAVLPW